MIKAEDGYEIELRLHSESRGTFRTISRDGITDNQMYPMVRKWNYIVQNRMRLSGQVADSTHVELERIILEYFPTEERVIEDMSAAEIIEVAIPFESEDSGWAARLFPWEDALTMVTQRFRTHQLTVVRHLMCRAATGARELGQSPGLLRVSSTPGELAGKYNFEGESKLVHRALGSPASNYLTDPSAGEVEQMIAGGEQEIIHLSVVDSHVMSQLRPDLAEKQVEDGVILSAPDEAVYDMVDYRRVADILTAHGTHQPALVSFATCFSGARMAPLVVGRGATAAIGFRDTLFDTVSEAFFKRFYTVWRDSGWDLLAAFQSGLHLMRNQDQRYRSVVMLWSAVSVLPPSRPFVVSADAGRARAAPPIPRGTPEGGPAKKIDPERSLVVLCEPKSEMNYCALHNRRELFEKFEIKKTDEGLLPPVEVEVDLIAENERAEWRRSVEFGESPGSEDLLEKGVHVPLGSRSFRRVQESTRSSLYIKVTCGDSTRYLQTTDVTLLPVDQWSDTDEDRRWLPSFVLPRDPAIRKILASADRYYRALTDDSHAGFDGYQRIHEVPDIVDLQARAVWCALAYEWQLRYVNPPPTYTGWSQRLRTPSQILAEGRGTCIDLSLIFSSCMEYIGIYPVIILIAGHAFPGWWRSDDAHNQFRGFGYFESNTTDGEISALPPTAQEETAEWMVKRDGYREVIAPIREGSLAVIESTLLCTGAGFYEAMEAGQENLMDVSIFDALVDVQRARQADNPVTPLPIVSTSDDTDYKGQP